MRGDNDQGSKGVGGVNRFRGMGAFNLLALALLFIRLDFVVLIMVVSFEGSWATCNELVMLRWCSRSEAW